MLELLRALLFTGEGLIVTVLWIGVATRFAIVLKRGSIEQLSTHKRQAWLLWGIFFCIALAATFRFPLIKNLFAGSLGEEFSNYPRAVISIAGYLLLIRVCYILAGDLRPRWDWPLYTSLLTLLANTLIGIAARIGMITAESALIAVDALFHYLLLVLALRVTIPALQWSMQHESQPQMRLRLCLMYWTHRGIALWMLNDTADLFAISVGLAYDHTLIYRLAVLVTVPSFIIAYLIPASYFIYLLRLLKYFSALWTLTLVKVVERRASKCLGHRNCAADVMSILRSPEGSIYTSVIAILDRRKVLKASPLSAARYLATKLDNVAKPNLEYSEVVSQLDHIGRDLMLSGLRRNPVNFKGTSNEPV